MSHDFHSPTIRTLNSFECIALTHTHTDTQTDTLEIEILVQIGNKMKTAQSCTVVLTIQAPNDEDILLHSIVDDDDEDAADVDGEEQVAN